jgi:hypothetical protein
VPLAAMVFLGAAFELEEVVMHLQAMASAEGSRIGTGDMPPMT